MYPVNFYLCVFSGAMVKMERKFDETISALKCSGQYTFSVGGVALVLREGLARTGVELDNVQFIDTSEVILRGQGVILSVFCSDPR